MKRSALALPANPYPQPSAVLELLKPVTWAPPMWAFACGVVSSGASLSQSWPFLLVGVILAGPLLCAMSQAMNDWFDRHVDALNQPERPIPSGRVPGNWGLYIAIAWAGVSLLVASALGPWVFGATMIGIALAWAYSAPPLRLKNNGWLGNAAVGFSYEGLAWFTGAAAVLGVFPDWRIVMLAVLYSLGAHGIMTLNDFKAIAGDAKMGVRTLPVQLGAPRAARVACWVMAVPQVAVILLLVSWGRPVFAAAVFALLLAQFVVMRRYLLDHERLMREPVKSAALYNAWGVSFYILGMMISAFAMRGLVVAGI